MKSEDAAGSTILTLYLDQSPHKQLRRIHSAIRPYSREHNSAWNP